MAVERPPRSSASTRRHTHGVTNALRPIRHQNALCASSAAAGVAHIGDHEGHVGDVAGAEQEVAGEIDQHRPDREFARRRLRRGRRSASIGASSSGRVMATESSVIAHHTIHHDPGPNALQHERRDQAGQQDAEPGTGIEQAEQEVRPLGPRLRDRCRQRAAADESDRGADTGQQPRKAQHDEIARQRAQRQRRHAGQRAPAHRRRQPEALDQPARRSARRRDSRRH